MHNFINEKIQDLYNYLAEDCSEGDINYGIEYVAEKIESHLRLFRKYDLIHFEKSIDEWDSVILEKLARILGLVNYTSVEASITETIYLLAFIHCDYEDAQNLLENLAFELSDSVVLNQSLLEKALKRIEEFNEGYTFFNHKFRLERTKDAYTLIHNKLMLIK